MKPSAIVFAIAAASLALGSFSAFAQGRVYDRNASNNPEIYRETHPEDAANAQNLQGPPRRVDRPVDRDHRRAINRGDERRDFNRRDDRRDVERRHDRHDRPDRFDRHDRHDYGRRDFDRRNYNQERHYHYGARGPDFRRGGYIPREYYNSQYYVNDWRGHHLAAPPYGHQWVQVGSDYVLIALATGLIAHLILNQ